MTGWQGAHREIKSRLDCILKVVFYFGGVRDAGRSLVCILHSESPERTLDVWLDLLILFPCQYCCLVGHWRPGDTPMLTLG